MGILCSCFVRSEDDKKDPLTGENDLLNPVKISRVRMEDQPDPLKTEEPSFFSSPELNSTGASMPE